MKRLIDKIYFIPCGGCWLWEAAIDYKGYGRFHLNGEIRQAHRVSYEYFNNTKIPNNLHLDHLCRNRSCVNPEHLEPVSVQENILRGIGATAINAKKTHCPYGHEYNEFNTYIDPRGYRNCKICARKRKSKKQ